LKDLVKWLRARHPDLDDTLHAHVRETVAGPTAGEDAEYDAGLYAAVSEAIDYALNALEQGGGWSEPAPPAVVAQARRAANIGVSLDTVLRRYQVGHAKLVDFILEAVEHENSSMKPAAVRAIIGLQASVLDRLAADVSMEYAGAVARAARSSEQQLALRVQSLLTGTSFDVSGLNYEFDDAWHICITALGARAQQAVTGLANVLGASLLLVPRGEKSVWAWLGGPRRLSPSDIERAYLHRPPAGVTLALGEPGKGFDGWRLTHRQAQAALAISLLTSQPLTRYADVAVLAPWVLDHALARAFIAMYLSPLDEDRSDGLMARETLRAYFEAGHQVRAAAATLKVDRSTLRKRLTAIERRLGYALRTRQTELEVALRLEALSNGRISDVRLVRWRELDS
jgi:hypothetical protein